MIQAVTPTITAGEAKKIIDNPDVLIIDARGGADAYERYKQSHVRGALFFDLETELSQKGADPAYGGRHPLPAPERFGVLLGERGISPSHHLVVYDDKSGSNAAARFWWMLKASGHSRIQVVDGGYAAIIASGLPVTTGEEKRAPKQAYPVTNWELPLADIETIERAAADNTYLIVDVRENYRYRGESEPIDLVAGHIPGAVNAPYVDNLEIDGRFRSPQVLGEQFKALIQDREVRKLIVHCGSGVTACHTLLAMELAGVRGAKLYVGSWSEWSRRKKPVSRGPNP